VVTTTLFQTEITTLKVDVSTLLELIQFIFSFNSPKSINLEFKIFSERIPNVMLRASPLPIVLLLKPSSKEDVFPYESLWKYLFYQGWVRAHQFS
jgi:hypothetical protein